MKSMKAASSGLLILILVVTLLLPSGVAAQQTSNLLKNPGFEGDYEIQCSFPGGKPWIAVPCDGPLPSRPWQTARMAPGWAAWWQMPSNDRSAKDYFENYPSTCGKPAPSDCVPWHMPEYKDTRSSPQDPPRIRSGENSQMYFTFWSIHEGGVYQVVEGVRPGLALRFSIYLEVWSATKLGGLEPNPHFSFGQTGMHVKIGIDPTGGDDPWSRDIVWSPEQDAYDQFTRFEVQAVARSTKVTVFTYSRPENPMEHNDVYLDDAELVPAGGGYSVPVTANPPPAMVAVGSQGTPVPTGGRVTHIVKPGDTLFALALQYGVPVDQIMALNNLTPESRVEIGRELIISLPAPKPLNPNTNGASAANGAPNHPFPSIGAPGSGRGTICVEPFLDQNRNDLLLTGEAPLPATGAHVVVLNAQGETVAERTLDGQSTRVCFTDLPATTYRVVAQPPLGYLATLQNRWAVSLPSDATINIPFGAQVDPTTNQTTIPAAIVIGLVVIGGVAGGLAWRIRRRHRQPKANDVYW